MWLLTQFGRGGGTAIAPVGPLLTVNRLWNNSAAGGRQTTPDASQQGSVTGATANTTCSGAANTSGQNILTPASMTGFIAGDPAAGVICIQDAGLARVEWATIDEVLASTLVLSAPLQFTHPSGDTIRNMADCFAPEWVAGGSVVEILFHYGWQTTGDSYTVQVNGQVWQSNLTQ